MQAPLHTTDLCNEVMTSRAQTELPRVEQIRQQCFLLPLAGTSWLWMRVPG